MGQDIQRLNYAYLAYLHIHTVLAALSSSFKTTRRVWRSATTRMNTGVCQKGGSIYINYFNIKIYIHTLLLAGVLLLFRGFKVFPFDCPK